MEVSVKEILNKNIQERYSDGRERVELREIIENSKDASGKATLNISFAKEFSSTYGYNYVCHLMDIDDVFFFSSTSLKKTLKELLKIDSNFFDNGEVLSVVMENREIMGKMSATVIEVL